MSVHSLSKFACNDGGEICVFGMLKCAGITILLVRHPPFNSRSFCSFQSRFHHFCLIQSALYGICRTTRIDPDRRVVIPAYSNIPNTHISPRFTTEHYAEAVINSPVSNIDHHVVHTPLDAHPTFSTCQLQPTIGLRPRVRIWSRRILYNRWNNVNIKNIKYKIYLIMSSLILVQPLFNTF